MAGKRIIKAGYVRLGTGPSTEGPDAHQPVWWDRGYLPHVESPRMIQHVTFRLADSLPRAVVEQMVAALKEIPPMERKPEWVRRVQGYLDAGYGSCILREPSAGELVQKALLHFHGERYDLHAWCVMPNHVHVLFQVHEAWTMSRCVWSWKSFTGRLINQLRPGVVLPPGALGRALADPMGGQHPVWHREYFDRYIRDEAHYMNAVNYIHRNPVKSGLVERAVEWQWSSAGQKPQVTTIQ
jgi:REP element-mobilizing transposase RayT